MQDCVWPSGEYGITGDGTTAIGLPTLDKMAPDAHVDHCIIEENMEQYYWIPMPPGNYHLANGTLAGLTDAAGNYIGQEPSSTALPQGADATAIHARLPWVDF
jgi:hypothetical protein